MKLYSGPCPLEQVKSWVLHLQEDLTQKFLPLEHCQKLLDGVNVKSNSTIDFKKIRENASKIPIEERESQFIEDFTKIIRRCNR